MTNPKTTQKSKKIAWGFNPLAILAAISMSAAMFFPWWHFGIAINDPTEIYPYLVDGPASEMVGYKRSPTMLILTILLLVCIILVLLGSIWRSKVSVGLIITGGALILLAVWRFYLRMESVSDGYHMPVQGHGFASYGGFGNYEVNNWFQPGIYLATVAGILALLAGVFHYQLWTGRKKASPGDIDKGILQNKDERE